MFRIPRKSWDELFPLRAGALRGKEKAQILSKVRNFSNRSFCRFFKLEKN